MFGRACDPARDYLVSPAGGEAGHHQARGARSLGDDLGDAGRAGAQRDRRAQASGPRVTTPGAGVGGQPDTDFDRRSAALVVGAMPRWRQRRRTRCHAELRAPRASHRRVPPPHPCQAAVPPHPRRTRRRLPRGSAARKRAVSASAPCADTLVVNSPQNPQAAAASRHTISARRASQVRGVVTWSRTSSCSGDDIRSRATLRKIRAGSTASRVYRRS